MPLRASLSFVSFPLCSVDVRVQVDPLLEEAMQELPPEQPFQQVSAHISFLAQAGQLGAAKSPVAGRETDFRIRYLVLTSSCVCASNSLN